MEKLIKDLSLIASHDPTGSASQRKLKTIPIVCILPSTSCVSNPAMFCPTCHNNPCKALLYTDVHEGGLSSLHDSLDSSQKKNISIAVLILESMEPLTIGFVFASQKVLSPSSITSAPMPTTFILVIETWMKMEMISLHA